MGGRHLRRTPGTVARAVLGPVAIFTAGVVVGGGTVVALDRGPGPVPVASAEALTPPSTAPSAALASTTTAVADPGPIRLAFVGDIYAEHGLADRLRDDPRGFVGPFAEVLHGADLVVGNLEAALATGGTAETKEYTFRAPPEILGALRAGGVDVVSVANNHGMDYGAGGLAETLASADDHPEMVLGVGHDEDEAYAPIVRTVGGHRVAVIGATQVIGGSFLRSWPATTEQAGLASAKRVDRLVREVAAAGTSADVVVVFLHWGVETEACPSAAQQELARALVGAGADVVVGSHAHRVQGAGRMGDAVVGYGLGNFLFHAGSPGSASTGVLTVDVDPAGPDPLVQGYGWVPGRIVAGVPEPLTGADASAALTDWHDRRPCTNLDP